MITKDQLDTLQDMFANYDDDWLLDHLSVRNIGDRNFVIDVDNGNLQDCDELFPGEYWTSPTDVSAPEVKSIDGAPMPFDEIRFERLPGDYFMASICLDGKQLFKMGPLTLMANDTLRIVADGTVSVRRFKTSAK